MTMEPVMDTTCLYIAMKEVYMSNRYITQGDDMRNILGALILAGAIALPFVIYFWRMTP